MERERYLLKSRGYYTKSDEKDRLAIYQANKAVSKDEFIAGMIYTSKGVRRDTMRHLKEKLKKTTYYFNVYKPKKRKIDPKIDELKEQLLKNKDRLITLQYVELNRKNEKEYMEKIMEMLDTKQDYIETVLTYLYSYYARTYLIITNTVQNEQVDFVLSNREKIENILETEVLPPKIMIIQLFKESNKSIENVLYSNCIYPLLKDKNVKEEDPIRYKQLMVINDMFKKFGKILANKQTRWIRKNSPEKLKNWKTRKEALQDFDYDSILNREDIIAFCKRSLINRETNKALSNANISSDDKLTNKIKYGFLSNMQYYFSSALHTYLLFVQNKDLDYFGKETNKPSASDVVANNLSAKINYILQIEDKELQDFLDNAQKEINELRNKVFHYKVFQEIVASDGRIQRAQTPRYQELLWQRYEHNHLYKIAINGELLKYKQIVHWIETQILNINTMRGSYSFPKFKDVYNFREIETTNIVEQDQAIRYFWILNYKFFLSVKSTYIATQRCITKTDVEKFAGVKKKSNSNSKYEDSRFSELMDEFLATTDSRTLLKLREYIQLETSKIQVDIDGKYKYLEDQRIKLINKKNKLERAANQFEAYLIACEWIDYDSSKVTYHEEVELEEPTLSSVDIEVKHKAFYYLGRLLNRQDLASLINDVYRYHSLCVNTIGESVSKDIYDLILMLSRLKVSKDIVLSTDNSEINNANLSDYLTEKFIKKYVKNEEQLKRMRRIEMLCFYEYNLGVKLKPLNDMISVEDLKQQAEQLHKEVNENKNDHEKLKQLIQTNQKLSYTRGDPVLKAMRIKTGIQSKLVRTMYLIEKDISKLFYHEFKVEFEKASIRIDDVVFAFGEENPSVWKILSPKRENKVIQKLKKKDRVFETILNVIDLETRLDNIRNILFVGYNSEVDKLKFFSKYRELRNHIAHLDWFKNVGKHSKILMNSNQSDAWIGIVYDWLKYDLKKQKSFLTSIENVFLDENIIVDLSPSLLKHDFRTSGVKQVLNPKKKQLVAYDSNGKLSSRKIEVDLIDDDTLKYIQAVFF